MGRLYANKQFYEISDMTEESTIDSQNDTAEEPSQYNGNTDTVMEIQKFILLLVTVKSIEVSIAVKTKMKAFSSTSK